MKLLIILMIFAGMLVAGCVYDTTDMQLQNYSEPIISMELNHAKTTAFCQANGYNKAEQWIIGEEHSGMYGQKVGYNLWGMDGSFNSNDRRVHVDCKGDITFRYNHSIQDAASWLESINSTKISNYSLDIFCQQNNTNLEYRIRDIVVCYRFESIEKEYTPQDIAKWYIQNS